MPLGIALSLIGVIISMEESGGGFLARWKWKWELLLWARKCVKNTSEVLYKKCVAEFVKEIVRNYESRIFSEEEIKKLCGIFLNKYPKAVLDKCELNRMLVEFNKKRLLLFSPAEKSIHDGMKEGIDNIKKEVTSSKEEIMAAITNEKQNDYWDVIIQKMNDSKCSTSEFGMFVVEKSGIFLERVVMLFPSIIPEKKEKYQKLFNQCCLESNSVNPYEVVVNALSKNFEGYVDRYKGLNGLYYSSEFVDVLKKCNVKPQASVNIDSIVDSIVACLKKGYKWENENALSEYVEYFFDILTDNQIIKLAVPYIEIFVDDYRKECSPYGSRDPFKNKVIAQKIAEKIIQISMGKQNAIYPAIKHFFKDRKRSDETKVIFKNRMWNKYKDKLKFLKINKTEFIRMSI